MLAQRRSRPSRDTDPEDVTAPEAAPSREEQIKALQEEIDQLRRQLDSSEEQIQTSEEFGRIVGNYVATWEYWIAPQGELIYISPACKTVTGHTPEEFFESEDLLTNIIFEGDLEYVAGKRELSVVEDDHEGRLEICFRIKRRDGSIRCIKQISQKVYGLDGIYLGRRVSNIDLSEFGMSIDDCRRLMEGKRKSNPAPK